MKSARLELDGITPIVNTPFDSGGAIDYASLDRLLERGIADGIVGCIVPAVASEVGYLAEDERREYVEAVIDTAADRIKVVVGVSSDDLAASIRLAEHALTSGADTVMCRVPERLLGEEDAVVGHFSELARVGMTNLMIQDLQWNGPGMPIETIARLYAEIESFTAIKVETSPPGPKYSAILRATEGGLHVACGWGLGQMIEALDRGVSTFTTTAINLPFVEVHRLYRAGDREAARRLFDETAPMLIWCLTHLDVSIHFLKRYCVAAGLFSTAIVRQPGFEFDEVHRRIADELITSTLALESRLRSEQDQHHG
jgi:dihydrodipicolinate synthase/N-acetylneuraminate lyase